MNRRAANAGDLAWKVPLGVIEELDLLLGAIGHIARR
jgi:hypothetical protein